MEKMEDKIKKVSIIVPVYNVSQYLEKCIDSILEQSYSNLEVILVDDGSTDISKEIVDSYYRMHSEIIVAVHQENGGLSAARNKGLDIATGDYISFIDSDDYVEKNMISEMVCILNHTLADIAVCGRIDEYEDGRSQERFVDDNLVIMNGEECIRRILTWNKVDIAACDKLYVAKLWKNVRFPKGRNNEDICTIPQIIYKANKIVHVASPFYHYCHRKNSITTTINKKKVNDFNRAIEDIRKFVEYAYPMIDNELIYYLNHQYLSLLMMMQAINDRGEEYKNAKKYLRENWYNPFSLKKMTKKELLVKRLIDLNLYSIIYNIKSRHQSKIKK